MSASRRRRCLYPAARRSASALTSDVGRAGYGRVDLRLRVLSVAVRGGCVSRSVHRRIDADRWERVAGARTDKKYGQKKEFHGEVVASHAVAASCLLVVGSTA